jgi:tetratricopeptide (TPR) repeat protein
LDPAAWLAPTPRERAEAILVDLAKLYKRPGLLKEWAAEAKTYIPSFETLLRVLFNATVGHTTTDESVAALEFLMQFADTESAAHCALLYAYIERKTYDKALALMPSALERAKEFPAIFHNAACLYADAGNLDLAMKAVEDAKRYHYDEMDKIRDEPSLARLHTRKAWQRVFAKKTRRA